MIPVARTPAALAAFSGGLAVIIGAFGAHGAANAQAAAWLETGGHYLLAHAIAALLALAFGTPRAGRTAAWLFLIGGWIFCGTLALMATGGPRWLGAVTPIGGTALIIGWLVLAAGFLTRR